MAEVSSDEVKHVVEVFQRSNRSFLAVHPATQHPFIVTSRQAPGDRCVVAKKCGCGRIELHQAGFVLRDCALDAVHIGGVGIEPLCRVGEPIGP